MPDTIESRITAQKAVVDGLITAANNKTGVSFDNLPEAVEELIDGYHSGGEDPAVAAFIAKINQYSGEHYTQFSDAAEQAEGKYFLEASYNNNLYCPVFETAFTSINSGRLRGCTFLKKLIAPSCITIAGTVCYGDARLETVYLPVLTNISGSQSFQNCTSLKSVQFGSLNHPFSKQDTPANTFAYCTQNDLVITIYVNDNETLPLGNAPWGATNATVVYRSATTGEVIPVE